jgi:excisionase family DNA binding protein
MTNASPAAEIDGTANMLIGVDELVAMLKVSKRTVYRLVATGRLPAPLRVGSRTVRWSRAAVTAWINAGCPRSTRK